MSEHEEALLERLKEKHGPELHTMRAKGMLFVVRLPKLPEFDKYMAAQLADATKHIATRALFKDCCVYPDRAELETIIERLPGISLGLGAEVAKLAGAGAEVEVGKA